MLFTENVILVKINWTVRRGWCNKGEHSVQKLAIRITTATTTKKNKNKLYGQIWMVLRIDHSIDYELRQKYALCFSYCITSCTWIGLE